MLLKLHNLLQHPLGNNRRLDVEMFLNLNTLGSSIPASSHRKHFVPIQATPNEQDHLESALPQLSFGAPQASHRGPGSLARPSAALMACDPSGTTKHDLSTGRVPAECRPVGGWPISWGVCLGRSSLLEQNRAKLGEFHAVLCERNRDQKDWILGETPLTISPALDVMSEIQALPQ